jgi:hypothetical protein
MGVKVYITGSHASLLCRTAYPSADRARMTSSLSAMIR